MISHVVLQIIPRLYNEQHYNIVHFFFQKFTKKTFMVRIQLHLGLKLKKKHTQYGYTELHFEVGHGLKHMKKTQFDLHATGP